jgi:hypothetical protein
MPTTIFFLFIILLVIPISLGILDFFYTHNFEITLWVFLCSLIGAFIGGILGNFIAYLVQSWSSKKIQIRSSLFIARMPIDYLCQILLFSIIGIILGGFLGGFIFNSLQLS